MAKFPLFSLLALLPLLLPIMARGKVEEASLPPLPAGFGSNHTNNWAVLVDTSRFWFNYRHVANVLSIYRSVKRLVSTE